MQTQPIALKLKILNIQKYATTPYIHCSKLNSTLLALKNALNPICSYVDEKEYFTDKESEAASQILHDLYFKIPVRKKAERRRKISRLTASPVALDEWEL